MKKTKIGQGRKLLLRGEAVATLAQADLRKIGGGEAPVSGANSYPDNCTSHPTTFATAPNK